MLERKNCILYSGGLQGAESYFGEMAEKWGVNPPFPNWKSWGHHFLEYREKTLKDALERAYLAGLGRLYNLRQLVPHLSHRRSYAVEIF